MHAHRASADQRSIGDETFDLRAQRQRGCRFGAAIARNLRKRAFGEVAQFGLQRSGIFSRERAGREVGMV